MQQTLANQLQGSMKQSDCKRLEKKNIILGSEMNNYAFMD